MLLLGTLSLAFSVCSGIALSYNVSVTILSGFTPLVASMMIERTGMVTAPAYYIAACTLLTFASSFLLPRAGSRRHVGLEAQAA